MYLPVRKINNIDIYLIIYKIIIVEFGNPFYIWVMDVSTLWQSVSNLLPSTYTN